MLSSLVLSLCLLSPAQPLILNLPQPAQVQNPKPATAPTLSLPAEIRVKHGLALIVPLEHDCDDITWNILDEGIEPLPPGLIVPPFTFCVQTFDPGTYRVQAVGVKVVDGKAKATAFQTTKVIVGSGPGPGPKPDPPTPEPTDPLFSKLKTAWATDGKDTAGLSKLKAAYTSAAPVLLSAANIKTCKDFWDAMHQVMEGTIKGKMLAMRRALADEMNAVLVVSDTAPLTDEIRAVYRQQFARWIPLFEALK